MAQKEAWRAYYELALGLTETSRKKAMKIVQDVAGKGGTTADQVQELVNAGLANREAMARMVRVELDRALGRVGLATMDEVDELTKRVRDLERQLHQARAGATGAETVATPDGPATGKPVAKKAVAKKTVTTTPVAAPVDTAPAESTPPAKSAAPVKSVTPAKKVAPATKAVASRASANNRTPTKAAATKTAVTKTAAAKKAPAKKAAGGAAS